MTAPAGGESRWEGRRRAREAALQILYQTEVGQLTMADAARTHDAIGADAIELDDAAREYAVQLARGSWEAKSSLDAYIADAARDEAIELARLYSGEDAAKFVNGVLDGVFTRLKQEGKVVD
jgi:transcription termination factor NusB